MASFFDFNCLKQRYLNRCSVVKQKYPWPSIVFGLHVHRTQCHPSPTYSTRRRLFDVLFFTDFHKSQASRGMFTISQGSNSMPVVFCMVHFSLSTLGWQNHLCQRVTFLGSSWDGCWKNSEFEFTQEKLGLPILVSSSWPKSHKVLSFLCLYRLSFYHLLLPVYFLADWSHSCRTVLHWWYLPATS